MRALQVSNKLWQNKINCPTDKAILNWCFSSQSLHVVYITNSNLLRYASRSSIRYKSARVAAAASLVAILQLQQQPLTFSPPCVQVTPHSCISTQLHQNQHNAKHSCLQMRLRMYFPQYNKLKLLTLLLECNKTAGTVCADQLHVEPGGSNGLGDSWKARDFMWIIFSHFIWECYSERCIK